jgi:hypothetical protein
VKMRTGMNGAVREAGGSHGLMAIEIAPLSEDPGFESSKAFAYKCWYILRTDVVCILGHWAAAGSTHLWNCLVIQVLCQTLYLQYIYIGIVRGVRFF